MFPEDRFNPLLPNAEKLHEDLWEAAELEFTPRTSAELGSKLVLHQFLPAWDVQAYIRVAKLQLHVHNSKYPSYEATGTQRSASARWRCDADLSNTHACACALPCCVVYVQVSSRS